MSFDELDVSAKLKRFIFLYEDFNFGFIQCLNSFINKCTTEEIIHFLTRLNGPIKSRKLLIFSYARCLVDPRTDLAKKAASIIIQICQSGEDILMLISFIGDGYVKSFINPTTTDGLLFILNVNQQWMNRSQRKLCFNKFFRRTLAHWYNEAKPASALAYDLTCVQSKFGWSHVDAIRLMHIKPKDESVEKVLKFVLKRHVIEPARVTGPDDVNNLLRMIEELRSCRDDLRIATLITEHNLQLNQLPPFVLNKSRDIWKALLVTNPLDIILENFLRMAKLGLFAPDSSTINTFISRMDALTPIDSLKPIQIMKTWKDYELGRNSKGSTWIPQPVLLDCFSRSFYRSCKNFQRSGKKLLLCMSLMDVVDNKKIANSNNLFFLNAAATSALCFINNEPNCHLFPISSINDLDLEQDIKVHQLVQHWNMLVDQCDMCEMTPIAWATMQQIKFDLFLIFTFVPPQINENFYAELSTYRIQLNQPTAKVVFIYFSQQSIPPCSLDAWTFLLNGMDLNVPNLIHNIINNNFDR